MLARYTAPGSFDADDMMLAMVTCEQPSQDAPFAPLISVGLMRPSATGRVALISRDPAAQPYVSLNYVSHPEDMRRLIDGVRLAVRIAQSAEMAETIADIADIDVAMLASDDRLGEYVRGTVDTFCHALGTARMGPETDKRAVVDQYCRVRGVENLWVADASVMPTVPHVMPNLTTIMIGERVADWLR